MDAGVPDTARIPRLLISPEHAAQMLDVSRGFIYELIKNGTLPALKLSTTPGTRAIYRLRPDDLQRYVETLRAARRAERADRARLVQVR